MCLALAACGNGTRSSGSPGVEAFDEIAGVDADHDGDDVADSDATCVPEDDRTFCARLGRECDVIAGDDNCGVARSVDCGGCPAGEVCGALSLGVCDCPPETNAAFCARAGRACGPLEGTDGCGAPRSVASCGTCRDGGLCLEDGTCLGPCGDLGEASCCDAAGDALQCVAGALKKLDCPDTHPCAWVQNFEVYSCGGQDGVDPAGSPISCDAYSLPPPCVPETDEAFCERTGAECGDPPLEDSCGRIATHDCGTCPGAGEICNRLGRCTTCGDGVVEVGEECDDGDLDESDDCTRACRWNGLCDDTCPSERNGTCDDGARDAGTERCAYGTDCGDCGLREDDACQGFPLGATCAAGPYEGLTTCGAPRGESYPARGFTPCRERERCVAGASAGGATCQLEPQLACHVGASACVPGALRTCDASGQWATTPCDTCVASTLGSWCATSGGRVVTGLVSYDYRAPNADLTDWGEAGRAPLGGARVVSMVRDGDAMVIFDVAVSGADGAYRVRVPDPPGEGDRVLVELASLDLDGALRFAVADPDLSPTGTRGAVDAWLGGERALPWSYEFEAVAVVADPALHLSAGSGAARLFDVVRDVTSRSEAIAGTSGASLVAWLQPDVSWDCGACFAMVPTQLGDAHAEAAMWISYDSDEEYWSRAAIVHELGHWAMASFGTATLEGGLHVLQPTLPGQAWNEGFATFFSSLARADGVYSDKQYGAFWWADLGAIAYSDGTPFSPATRDARGYPDVADPILQMMDEFTVAATLWSIANAVGGASPPTLADQGRLVTAALSGPRMNVVRRDPSARFARGYVRHTWSFDDALRIVDITPHPAYSEPMLADYLDALRCTDTAEVGVGHDLDAAIAAAVRDYPYPVDRAPLCQPAPPPPLTATLDGPPIVHDGDTIALRLTIDRPLPDGAPLEVSLVLPPGVELGAKAREVIRDASTPRLTRDYPLRVARVPKTDLIAMVTTRSAVHGVTARVVYRFGRSPPSRVLTRDVLRDRGGRVIARAVRARPADE